MSPDAICDHCGKTRPQAGDGRYLPCPCTTGQPAWVELPQCRVKVNVRDTLECPLTCKATKGIYQGKGKPYRIVDCGRIATHWTRKHKTPLCANHARLPRWVDVGITPLP
jgi:hypothetical protein